MVNAWVSIHVIEFQTRTYGCDNQPPTNAKVIRTVNLCIANANPSAGVVLKLQYGVVVYRQLVSAASFGLVDDVKLQSNLEAQFYGTFSIDLYFFHLLF